MTSSPDPSTLHLPGQYADLHTLQLGQGPVPVLAVHGISSSAMAWGAVAEELSQTHTVFAPDLRGRGGSREASGPFGLASHAEDIIAAARRVAELTGVRPLLIGHSMGAYVCTLASTRMPDLFERVVLVDGAVPLPMPSEMSPDEVLAATLGPALERLRTVYPDEQAYVDFFRDHPALGPHWNRAIEAYVRYDVLLIENGVRSRATDESVRADGRDLVEQQEALDAALRAVPPRTRLLTAPGGMFGDPPGLLPGNAVARYATEVPSLTVESVPESNHYTILFAPHAALRVADVVRGEP